MRVILLKDIRGIGRHNDVKEVADGYARNFLIAKGLASPVTPKAIAEKAAAGRHESAVMQRLTDAAEALGKETLKFALRGDAKGTLFGAVSGEQVEAALRAKGYADAKVTLERPLKHAGEQKVEVHFPRGVKGTVRVVVEAMAK
ncbi:MAG: 50S ribosomal protein L9 [bacterium]|nr:50S ribosomal protein L9 [bacterium]